MNISHEALGAAIAQAHQHKLKITGHLCSVGFSEAAELGIDNLEHGLVVDSEFTPGKKRNVCPDNASVTASIMQLDLNSAQAKAMIETLVKHHVAAAGTRLGRVEIAWPRGIHEILK